MPIKNSPNTPNSNKGLFHWSQGSRPRNTSITSSTSTGSTSTVGTEISPYIHLIHSDSFVRRHSSGSPKIPTDISLRDRQSVEGTIPFYIKHFNSTVKFGKTTI